MLRPDFSLRYYPAIEVLEVHDGDTFRLLLDRGGDDAWFPWLRLRGFSCPELKMRDATTGATVDNPDGLAARQATITLLTGHDDLLWVVTHRAPRPYKVKRWQDDDQTLGRYLAEVWLADDALLGDELVKLSLARPGSFVG